MTVGCRIMVSKHTPGVRGDRQCFGPGDPAILDSDDGQAEKVTIRSYHVLHPHCGPDTPCYEYTFDDDSTQHLYCCEGKYFRPLTE